MLENDASTKSMGIEIQIPEAGAAVAVMTVRDDMANGFNVCHGGVVFTLADTAFAFACNAYNSETLSANATIKWLLPVRPGERLVATASEERREGRHGYYSIIVRNQDDVVVAEFSGHSIATGTALFEES
jgi:acyl-CoA thioesterase